ncbi:MAG: hypothetical protein WDZ30_01855 [Cellvibrionaceae bacterium]
MRSITGYLPWGLLALSLGVIGANAVQTESIQLGPDEQGLCKAHSAAEKGTQLRLRVRNQHWIWLDCPEPDDT